MSWVYVLTALFVLVNIFLISIEFYYLLALPVLAVLLWQLLVKPVRVFYLIAFATPLSIQWSNSSDSLSMSIPTEPLIILLFIGLLFRLVHKGHMRWGDFINVLSLLIAADFLWMAIASVGSSMPIISLKYMLAKLWYVVVFYFFAVRLFKQDRIIKTFMWSFAVAVCILAIYTLYRHSLGSFSRSYAYTAMRPFMPDHGMYAACISFAVPLLFVFSWYGRELNYSVMVRLIAAGMMIFLIFAVALSFTRASWLSLVVAFSVYAALLLRIRFSYLLLIAVSALAILSYNLDDILTDLSRNKSESDDNIEEHLQSVSNVSSDPSNMERLNRWSCAYRMYQERPVLGFGPGTYTFQYGVYQLPHQMTIISSNTGSLGNVHSEYLRPLVEEGLLGLLLMLGMVFSSCYMAFKQFYRLQGQAKFLSLAAFLALLTYFAHGVLNNYSEFDKIAVPLYAMLAVITAQHIKLRSIEKSPQKTD